MGAPEPVAAGAPFAGAATVGSSGGKVWVVVVVGLRPPAGDDNGRPAGKQQQNQRGC